ncbi:unnamed protein product [Vicia faba]|uniref:Uncharacterized protein n=1 Tax=Vicia faba TaxID=3906 RepID=A0AAV0YYL7_VICFA|nr:unnamed protein product [Vicia faba]
MNNHCENNRASKPSPFAYDTQPCHHRKIAASSALRRSAIPSLTKPRSPSTSSRICISAGLLTSPRSRRNLHIEPTMKTTMDVVLCSAPSGSADLHPKIRVYFFFFCHFFLLDMMLWWLMFQREEEVLLSMKNGVVFSIHNNIA